MPLEPKSVGADGAPTFQLSVEQMPVLKNYKAGDRCDFLLSTEIVSVKDGLLTLKWRDIVKRTPPARQILGQSDFQKAALAGDPKADNRVTYVKTEITPVTS